ncbi:hypothetical protein [Amphritea japonica]|uniref:Uncharacterized protein n=1 Tax=Amphritea japonica ATCC BAA-1530 TaxID=1278309 RepID=A0A7R6PDC5_9GAMM|nr:hypothetical protein [Amphritea japonica]BBB26976.1 conserved hypothetical protein [Amphritea japonica ATCC BAA-1530]
MMITDLIDQDDFFDLLVQAGVSLEQGWSPQQCSDAALLWLKDQPDEVHDSFKVLLAELQKQIPVMLPEVRDALTILEAGV